MPIYEYQCQACDKVSDFLQKMNDEPMQTCPECNEDQLKKLVSAPRFKLAGTGWYETDFKDGDKKNLTTSNSNNASSDEKSESSSETNSGKVESNTSTNTNMTSNDDGKAA